MRRSLAPRSEEKAAAPPEPAAGGGPAGRCRWGRNGRDSRGRHTPRVAPVGGDVTGCVLRPSPPPTAPLRRTWPLLRRGPPRRVPARRAAPGGGVWRAGAPRRVHVDAPAPCPPPAPAPRGAPQAGRLRGARRDVVVALGDKRGARDCARRALTGAARAQGCRGSTRHPTHWCRPRWPSWRRRRRS